MEKLLSKLIKYTPFFLLVAYFYGFLAWNSFLSRFGFFEYNILQTRYLSAGILFLGCFLVVIIFLYRLFSVISKIKNSKLFKTNYKIIFFVVFSLIFNICIFTPIIFPRIPQYLGGAQPLPISLIGTKEQIDFLRNFNTLNKDNEGNKLPFQTGTLCSIYENNDFVIFATTDENNRSRVLKLKPDQFSGISIIRPEEMKEAKNACTQLVARF
ncbi:MAG: hypothetical protein PHO91_03225 [Patescibacteria group bacterium]|nr:hypothetical protein [Patescibacteria group bacterium]